MCCGWIRALCFAWSIDRNQISAEFQTIKCNFVSFHLLQCFDFNAQINWFKIYPSDSTPSKNQYNYLLFLFFCASSITFDEIHTPHKHTRFVLVFTSIEWNCWFVNWAQCDLYLHYLFGHMSVHILHILGLILQWCNSMSFYFSFTHNCQSFNDWNLLELIWWSFSSLITKIFEFIVICAALSMKNT